MSDNIWGIVKIFVLRYCEVYHISTSLSSLHKVVDEITAILEGLGK